MKYLLILVAFLFISFQAFGQSYIVEGELKQWHKVSLVFDGPNTDELASLNPFADFKLEVTFTNGSQSYIVQGYYAADGNAAETSSNSGNKWIAHFSPDKTGTWSFTTTFEIGTDVAIGGAVDSTGVLHNLSGSFDVITSDKTGRDHRANCEYMVCQLV